MRHRHIMEMRSEMKYIESLREGERINEIYLCKVKQSALTKAGKPYDNLILQDKTRYTGRQDLGAGLGWNR